MEGEAMAAAAVPAVASAPPAWVLRARRKMAAQHVEAEAALGRVRGLAADCAAMQVTRHLPTACALPPPCRL